MNPRSPRRSTRIVLIAIVLLALGSSIFPWHDWSADADGVARIGEFPPAEMLWYGAHADGQQMKKRDRNRNPFAAMASGKVMIVEIPLEKTPESSYPIRWPG
ncbi:MAG TPA: hypothetical protein VM509_03635 [Planctomycetota bacterium]|nr:hypothetical protein [Planctomycetota bacterium]